MLRVCDVCKTYEPFQNMTDECCRKTKGVSCVFTNQFANSESAGLSIGFRPTHADNNRKWKAANPEKEREYRRKRYAKNRGKKLATNRKWKAANPEKEREYRRKNREKRMRANQISVSVSG